MGLFSSKKKTIVGLTTVPLIEEQEIFNESVLGAIFAKTNIAQSLAAEMRNGWIGKANKFYRQTKSKLNTESGTAIFTSYSSTNSLDNSLEAIFGAPINIHKYALSTLDVTYNAYSYIISNYGIDLDTDEVVIEGETVVFSSAFVSDDLLNMVFTKADDSELVITTEDYIRSTNEYFHLIYSLESAPADLIVWFYDTTSNIYPEINDNLINETYNDYYPVIVIRKDKVNTVDTNTDYNKNATRILNSMGVDLEFLTEQLMTNEEGQSDVVDDAFITFGLNIQDKYEGSIRYLYEYFYRIYLDIPDSKDLFETWQENRFSIKPEYSIKYVNDDFNSYIEWNYISLEVKQGSIEEKYTRQTIINGSMSDLYDAGLFILRKRIDDNSYYELTIHGLYHASEIIKGKIVIRTLKDSLQVPTSDDTADSGFYIPLSKTIVDSLPMIAKKQVLYAAFTVPIYTVQVVKIKWYQRGAFKALLYIAAIIITIITAGADGGSAIQIAVAIATNVITGIIINTLLEIAVNVLGVENSLVLALIATAVAIYNNGLSADGVPWAQELLLYTTLSFNAIGSVIQDEFVKLQNEISNFLQDAKEIQEDIEEAESLLNNSKYDFFSLSRGGLYFNPYETPDQFYNRSIYDQNPGVKSFDLLYNYVDRMLQLPERRYI